MKRWYMAVGERLGRGARRDALAAVLLLAVGIALTAYLLIDRGPVPLAATEPPPPCANGTVIASPATQPDLVADCTALLAAKDTLRGTAALNWSADTALHGWDGITVAGTPARVTELRLPRKSLTGSIPAELGNLSALLKLRLNGNRLTGAIPLELANLTNLTHLYLRGSLHTYTGCVPKGLSTVATNDIDQVDLPECASTAPCATEGAVANVAANLNLIADCTVLLAAKGVLEGADILFRDRLNWSVSRPLGQWEGVTVQGARVTQLHLEYKRLRGTIPAGLGELTGLTELGLADNRLTGTIPPALGRLTRLQLLSLVGNELRGALPAELGALTELRRLFLHQNDLTGEIPWELGDLQQLTHLYLDDEYSGCYPHVWQTVRNNNLDELEIDPCPPPRCANETAVPGYAAKPGLVHDCSTLLHLKDALRGRAPLNWSADRAFTSWDGVTVGGTPERLTVLAVGGRRLSGRIPAALGRLDGLTNLTLDRNELRGTVPPALGRLAKLRTLSLYRNRLTGPIPAELGNLAQLRTLTISQNYLTGTIPASLTGLTHLEALLLYQNRLTGSIPPGLVDLPLTDLFLSNNNLTGCLPRELTQITRNDLDQLNLDPCPLRSETLSYGAPTTTGSVTDDGDYAFLTDPDDLTSTVSTYEGLRTGLRDGTTIGLVLHQDDRAGASQAAFYAQVQANDVVEWREADGCWMRYVVREVHPDPAGDPPRKLLTIQIYSHPYPNTGCTGALRTSGSRTFTWTPAWFEPGTLPGPVWHAGNIYVPEGWSGTLPTGSGVIPPIATTWPPDPMPAPDLGPEWTGGLGLGYGSVIKGYYSHTDGGILGVGIARAREWPRDILTAFPTEDRTRAYRIVELRVIDGWPARVSYYRVPDDISQAGVGFYDAKNGTMYGFYGGSIAQRNDPDVLIELALQFLPDAP